MVNKTDVLKYARKLITDEHIAGNYLCNAIFISHIVLDEGKSLTDVVNSLSCDISLSRQDLLDKEYTRIHTRIQMELDRRNPHAETFTSVMDLGSAINLRLRILDEYIKMGL